MKSASATLMSLYYILIHPASIPMSSYTLF